MSRDNKIDFLRDQINKGDFPNDYPHFGGANLIITDDSKRNFHENDIVVYSEHASALSWLIVELKKIYNEDLNFQNKYSFYPYIGELVQASVKANDDLFETMFFVIEKIEEDWIKSTEIK